MSTHDSSMFPLTGSFKIGSMSSKVFTKVENMKEWGKQCLQSHICKQEKRHFYEFGGLKCPSFDELVLDSYEWWTSCIKAMRELIAGLKLGLNKSSTKHITVLGEQVRPCAAMCSLVAWRP